MGKLERLSIDLPEELARSVRAAIGDGRYASVSEVVRDALEEWEAERARKSGIGVPQSSGELAALIAEGEKGPYLDGPRALAELREKYRHTSA